MKSVRIMKSLKILSISVIKDFKGYDEHDCIDNAIIDMKNYSIGYYFNYFCLKGNIRIIKEMMKRYYSDFDYDFGMMYACEAGHKDIVELMIDNGAKCWNLCLSHACYHKQKEIVELMINKGADDLNRGMFSACRRGNKEIVKLMIKKGADNFRRAINILNDEEVKNNKETEEILEIIMIKYQEQIRKRNITPIFCN